MAKRGDNIHKRADGSWEGCYKKGRKPNGKIQYGSVYGKSYREDKSKLIAILQEPNVITLPKQKEKTFAEVLDLWMQNNRIRLKRGSINKYQRLIDTHISADLGSVKISEISSVMINSFLEEKLNNGRIYGQGGLSKSYVKSIMLVILQILTITQFPKVPATVLRFQQWKAFLDFRCVYFDFYS